MQHVEECGDVAMHIDHFDPRLKTRYTQDYSKLYLASSQCNIAKGVHWPTETEEKWGVRFLDPCAERDYGVHLFEDPSTHELVATTAAGWWQITICDLNAEHFVIERRERANLQKILTGGGRIRSSLALAREAISQLKEDYERKIPPIPPPPLVSA
jgi:hypothetical protein